MEWQVKWIKPTPDIVTFFLNLSTKNKCKCLSINSML